MADALELVERDWELAALEQHLVQAQGGAGGTIFIEGAPGTGKSSLTRQASELARRAGMQVFEAAGKLLERDFRFGVAIQLFEPMWLAYGSDERASLLAGAGHLAAPLLGAITGLDRPEVPGEPYAVIHGLFRVAYNLLPSPPDADGLAIVVDDAHLADAPSLRFLAYVAERCRELPIALVLAVTSGGPCAEPKALSILKRNAHDPVLHPSPLSADAVTALVHKRFPGAPGSVGIMCEELTAGNPLLLAELLDGLRAQGCSATEAAIRQVADTVPGPIREAVSARLAEMPLELRAVVKAVAAFTAGASIVQVSGLSGLATETVSRAADELATLEILRPQLPLAFVHPIVRAAVCASLSPLERQDSERRAALIRAEDPRSDVQVQLLCELRADEHRASLQTAEELLGTAQTISERLRRRAELALEKGRDLYGAQRYSEAAAVIEGALTELGGADHRLSHQLLATYVSAAALVDELQDEALERRRDMLQRLTGAPEPYERVAVAHTAVHDALRGASRDEVRLMVDLAWGNGALLRSERADAVTWRRLLAALVFTDELEHALEISDALLAGARRQPSALAAASIEAWRAAALFAQGRIEEAEESAEAALRTPFDDGSSYTPTVLRVIASCHLESGSLDQADTVLARLERQSPREPIGHPLLLELRARLRLTQHRPREALEDALHAGRIIRDTFPKASPGAVPWCSTAAFAHLALGEPWHARRLAEEDLHAARRIGLTSTVIRDLRALGLAAGGTAGLDVLAEAVTAGDSHPARLEHIKALVELGAALRRANRRADAREPLRRGLELSHKLGAERLAARAQVELVSTGARPRGAAFSGLDALTPSQHRVAGLAAQGLTTRQIAETLFVTPKTVEFHLRHIYQKLGVSSRGQLSAALEAA